MESLYLLIPLSVVLVLLIGGVLVWAVMSGQFEELDDAGKRVLDEEDLPGR
ncbi:MAG: cbb3-type cytochrome oxidase assembly protein CcoS [Burkholderiaceae bacterium]|jgi:cbb3-type cytochrome oxidase maturation protein|nr:cbb3-type cytochrome oxidase assembly protein CcoS [Burkholderiaceae bacterium]MDH5209272.1 cbb3-type cytochrome oxidase assembly protein CcoS [Burkholderiaceae bacterium]